MSVSKDVLSKYKEFAEIYVMETCYNGAKAYRLLMERHNAETTDNNIRQGGARLANNPTVRQYIRQLQQELAANHVVERERIAAKLNEIAFDDGTNYTHKEQLDALEKLNKMGGFYQDNLNVKAEADIDIVIE